MSASKKYKVNRNFAFYNFDIGMYQTQDGRHMTYEETVRNRWKCEKCVNTFPNLRLLLNHKQEYHSY